ncbi:MAG: Fe-S cluster assembly protein SufD [Elusimicrobiota bacterium]
MTLLQEHKPFSEAAGNAGGPLAAVRQRAWKAFESLPMPAKEDEAWRRTDISRLDLGRYGVSTETLSPSSRFPTLFDPFLETREGVLLIQDHAAFRRFPEGWEERGVVFSDLETAAKTHKGLIDKFLAKAVPSEKGKFEALNGALWNRGIFLYVPRNVDVVLPLHGGYGFTLQDGRAALPRTLIVLEEGARATYFDEYVSGPAPEGASALSCAAVEMFLGAGAQLQYINLQRLDRSVDHFLTQGGRLDRDAKLLTLAIALGGNVSKVNLGSELAGAGAESRLYGLVFGDGKQRFTHHTVQDHRVPHTSSDLLFKAALKDQARSIYTGMIHITPEAQKTEAFQTCRNLILSEGARADAIPMLEILADDVKCGHGASVGPLDEDQRFYLMTRGLSLQAAERAIVEGFFEEVLQRVPVEGTREKLHGAINAKLGAES